MPGDRSYDATMAQFALMVRSRPRCDFLDDDGHPQREVAKPIVEQPRAKGADTGFWKAMNRELKLKSHTSQFGPERRKGPKWIQYVEHLRLSSDHLQLTPTNRWEKDIIQADVALYGTGNEGVGDFVNTDDEEDDELNGEDTTAIRSVLGMRSQTIGNDEDPQE